jgi:hypothetical protein
MIGAIFFALHGRQLTYQEVRIAFEEFTETEEILDEDDPPLTQAGGQISMGNRVLI